MAISEETKKKMADAAKARWASDEYRKRMSDARKGKPGHPHSEETRRKISEANMGRPSPMKGKTHSEETRRKISESKRGMPVPEERRRRISETLRGRKLSPDHCQKMSDAMKGRVFSDEHRRKISEANMGKAIAPEVRAKISATLTGRKGAPCSPERKEKLSNIRKGEKNPYYGKKHSDEIKAKISAALKTSAAAAEIHTKQKEQFRGPGNPNWQGGINFAPYCFKFNAGFKERVRDFFGRVCVECGAPENGKRHAVHHVNFRKDACCSADVVPLFVPLCSSCHGKTQKDREYWEERFTTLINERHGGQCYLPKQTPPEPVPTT